MKYVFRGFGGHARAIIDMLPAEAEVSGYFDDTDQANNLHWLGAYDSSVLAEASLILSVGNNKLREQWYRESKHALATIIAANAYIAKTAEVGEGVVAMPAAVVQSGVKVGKGGIINIGALIDHDTIIGDFCHVAAGAVVGSRVSIGNRAIVGVGAIVPPASSVPADTVIPPGAVFNSSHK